MPAGDAILGRTSIRFAMRAARFEEVFEFGEQGSERETDQKLRWKRGQQMAQNRSGKPLQIYLDEAEREALLALSERTGRSVSEEVRQAIARHLASPPKVVNPPLEPQEVVVEVKPKKGRKKGEQRKGPE